MKFNFKRRKYKLQKAKYDDEHYALTAFDIKVKSTMYVLTVCLPDFDFPFDEFAMKCWGPNEEISEVIFNTGIFEDTGKRGSNDECVVEFWKLSEGVRITDIPPMK